jgi:hypothetical protein
LSLLAIEPTSRVDYYVSNAHAQLADTTTRNAAGMANMSPPMPRTSFMAAHVSHLACCIDLAYTHRFQRTSIYILALVLLMALMTHRSHAYRNIVCHSRGRALQPLHRYPFGCSYQCSTLSEGTAKLTQHYHRVYSITALYNNVVRLTTPAACIDKIGR